MGILPCKSEIHLVVQAKDINLGIIIIIEMTVEVMKVNEITEGCYKNEKGTVQKGEHKVL